MVALCNEWSVLFVVDKLMLRVSSKYFALLLTMLNALKSSFICIVSLHPSGQSLRGHLKDFGTVQGMAEQVVSTREIEGVVQARRCSRP